MVSLENSTWPSAVRSLSPGSTGRRYRTLPSRMMTGIGVMNAASRWRAVRTSLSIMPGISSMVANASRPPTQPVRGTVATTVAVRGASRSSAISPTMRPGVRSTTVSCPSAPAWLTSAWPEPINRKLTPRAHPAA